MSLHKTLDGFVTGETCLQYINKDIGILSKCPYTRITTYQSPSYIANDMEIKRRAIEGFETQGTSDGSTNFDVTLQKIANDKTKRVIGLILDTNDDGSFEVAILGNETFQEMQTVSTHYGYGFTTRSEEVSSSGDVWKSFLEPAFIYLSSGIAPEINVAGVFMQYSSRGHLDDIVSLETTFDYVPEFTGADEIMRGALLNTGRRGNDRFFDHGGEVYLDLSVTNNKNTTLVIGCAMDTTQVGTWCPFDELADSTYNFLAGNFYDFFEYNHNFMLSRANSFVFSVKPNQTDIYNPSAPDVDNVYATHTMQTVPVNLILTKNESFALNYLNNGTLPPDAFLFPMEWDNIPKNLPESDTDDNPPEGGDDPDNGETNPSGIEGDPTVDGNPQTTTNKLNNNNVYWLQIGELQSFITWFWNDAGAIIDASSLWNRITGLYNDLGQAIVMVRFFPVDPSYIGGTENVNSIIVGMIEKPNTPVKKLLKQNPTKITLGTQAISEKYNSFADYSPYTELQIYLPFHGWQALDIDIFMGNSVRVKAIYDYMSGTVQYLIYVVSGGNEYLVNTAVVKMAVDIPITLQSKNDRDSAIFGNIMNAAGTLIGASASAATKNPIGLTMAMQNVASIGAGGTNSAPIKMMGTQGENGAFFAPNRCAIYMKRPSYNRPKLYKSRVGYPCNRGVYLGSRPSGGDSSIDVATGFTTVYNPTITFKGNSYGGKRLLPMQSEIEEIYNYLTEGVIL